MGTVAAIVQLTFCEARRRRVLAAALFFGLAVLTVFGIGVYFANAAMVREGTSFVQRQATLTLLTIAGLYASNFLSMLLPVLLPIDTLSGEIDSGIMQTIAAKPIRRSEVVIGKWLGHGLIVSGYLALLFGGVLLIGWLAAGHVQVRPVFALLLMLLEVLLLLTIAIAGGTRLSTIANGVLALGFYGVATIGGLVEQIGGVAGLEPARTVGIAVSLISPPDALWRLAAYEMQPAVVRAASASAGPFASASVPNALMVWWAIGFLALTLAWALRSFDRRAL